MTLSIELFKACCASVAKMAKFASLDPLFGPPTGSAAEYLKKQNFSFDDIKNYYREALQKGPFILELAFQESEGVEENILTPFREKNNLGSDDLRKRIVGICRRLYSPEIFEELLQELTDVELEKILNQVGEGNTIFQAPDAFLPFLIKAANVASEDVVFQLLLSQKLLFQAVDYKLRSAILNDPRGKPLGVLSSFAKMKLRVNLVQKQIPPKEKQKSQSEQSGDTNAAKNIAQEIALYQNAVNQMSNCLQAQGPLLEQLHDSIAHFQQEVGAAVLEKAEKMQLSTPRDKVESETSGLGDVVDEVQKLTKQAVELLGEIRIEFSHNLLGPVLENQRGKIEKARTLFEKIPNTHQHKPTLANRLGIIMNAMGDPEKAAEYFRRALVLLPGSRRSERAPIESNLFHALLNRGHFDAALRYMMESLAAGSEDCNLFDTERYVPEKILGAGGMGVTFLCNDSYEDRKVVVKTLWRYATGNIKDIFSEAFTARKIDDPHIVKIYDIGRHRANRPFIVMEYCEGFSLEAYLKEVYKGESVKIEDALYIILEVAKGLSAAHRLNPPIIHRDIKPTNILFNPKKGDVKIIDFGIACMLPEPEKISRTVSLASASVIAKNMAGTWGYMAPEQQRGEAGLDPRVDMFSLGKTLMFLLTGKTPPPENIFALKADVREVVGELVGYCLMPHAGERYNCNQVIDKIQEIQTALAAKKTSGTASEPVKPGTSTSIAATPATEDDGMLDAPILEGDDAGMGIDLASSVQTAQLAEESAVSSVAPVQARDSQLITSKPDSQRMGKVPLPPALVTPAPTGAAPAVTTSGSQRLGKTPLPPAPIISAPMTAAPAMAAPTSGSQRLGKAPMSPAPTAPAPAPVEQEMQTLFDSSDIATEDSHEHAAPEGFVVTGEDNEQSQPGGIEEEVVEELTEEVVDEVAEQDVPVAVDQEVVATEISADEPQALSTEISADEPEALSTEPEPDPAPQMAGAMAYDLPADFKPLYDLETPTSATSDMKVEDGGEVVGSHIHVKEMEQGESCSIKPKSPLPKIDLPFGYHWSTVEEGDIVICDKDGATMIYVPPGPFFMGRDGEDVFPQESPEHEVTLEGFLIDQCPVTWYQYNLFCEETKRKPPANPGWEVDVSQPVVNITWEDANAYAKWAGKALPTEAQWEKAAKGGQFFDGDELRMQKNQLPRRKYPWGDVPPNDGGVWRANCVQEPEFGERSCSPVGTYVQGASPYGCFDLAGNIWEWCEDWYLESYYSSSPPTNPKGPRNGNGHVVRGGAWNSDHLYITATYRTWMEPDNWWSILGCRTALAIKAR